MDNELPDIEVIKLAYAGDSCLSCAHMDVPKEICLKKTFAMFDVFDTPPIRKINYVKVKTNYICPDWTK